MANRGVFFWMTKLKSQTGSGPGQLSAIFVEIIFIHSFILHIFEMDGDFALIW